MDTVARHTFTNERQFKAMSELSYHQPNQPFQQDHAPSYLQRLHAKAEELLTEGQAGFKPGRSTVEQIFNSRVIVELHLQLQPSAICFTTS